MNASGNNENSKSSNTSESFTVFIFMNNSLFQAMTVPLLFFKYDWQGRIQDSP